MNIFFSVVIPTYNRSGVLKRAIESVLAQSLSNFEILVMDDGSTDNTSAVVEAFNDPRITYEWDKNFGGPARPRNRGIAKAKGEWVCFLDADDWWKPNKLQICSEHINNGVDLIYHDLDIIREKPHLLKPSISKSWKLIKPALIDLLIKGNAISNSSVVVRKKLLDQIGGIDENPKMIASEDYNTWLRIAQLTDGFCYIPQSLGYYMLHNQGISQKDMSAGYRCATAGFICILNTSQQDAIKTNAAYLSGRYNYIHGKYSSAYENLLVCLKIGNLETRIKSLYMMIMLFIKKIYRRRTY